MTVPTAALDAAINRMGDAVTARDISTILEAARPHMAIQVLGEALEPEALERARKVVEDELIEWRDSGLFTLRRNGLSIRNQDGSGSEVIRFGFEMGLRIALNDRMASLGSAR